MRIGIVAHNMRVAGGLSVGLNIISALKRLADHHEYWLSLPTGVGYEQAELPSRSQVLWYTPAGLRRQFQFERTELPQSARAFRPDVIWGLGNFVTHVPGARHVVLLNDSHCAYGGRHHQDMALVSRITVWAAVQRLKKSMKYADLLLVQTNTMAKRVRSKLRFRGPIGLCPNAVSRFTDVAPAAPPPVFEKLRGRFVLFCLAKFYPHKNLRILADTFERYGEALRDVSVLLTVAEDHDFRAPAFMRRIEQPGLRDHLVNVGPLPQSALAAYYQHSRGMILPTVLESFSATHLEAMRFACPILTSDLDFAREVCGDAAIYFDPWNPATIRDAILQLRNSPQLAKELAERGTRRLDQVFQSWDEIVGRVLSQMEALVTGAPTPHLVDTAKV